MIISRTPFRISFFGGGTDYPEWYNKNGGMVISTSINRYSYISLRNLPPYFDYKYSIRYSKREIVKKIVSNINAGCPQFDEKLSRLIENVSLFPDISKAQNLLNWQPTDKTSNIFWAIKKRSSQQKNVRSPKIIDLCETINFNYININDYCYYIFMKKSKVLFNEKCSICNFEIKHYKKRSKLHFEDCSSMNEKLSLIHI